MKTVSNSPHPVIGLVGTLTGTVLALAFIPTDPSPAGALQISAACMAFGLLAGTIACIPQGYAGMLRGENVFNWGIIYWLLLDLLQGAYDLDISRAVIMQTFIAMGTLSLGIWLGASQRGWNLPTFMQREIEAPWRAEQIFLAGFICFVLAMLSFAIPTGFDFPLMFSAIGEARWTVPWGRGQLGGLDAIWDHFQYFGYVLPVLYVACGSLKGWRHPMTILLLAMTLLILAFLATGGGRRIIGVTVGAAIIYRILSAREYQTWKFTTAVAGAIALLYILQEVLLRRGAGWFEEAESIHYLHVDDNFLRLGQVIELVPDSHPFAYFDLVFFILIRPIPRLLWPGKPVDPGFDLPTMIGDTGASLSHSAIGDWYLIWGFPTVLIGGWFFGRLASVLNEMMSRQGSNAQPIAVSIGLMVLFASLRSLQDLVLMSYAVLGWFVVSYFVQQIAARNVGGNRLVR